MKAGSMVRHAACLIVPLLADLLFPAVAHGHATEQHFVLLLPTRLYIASGIAAVVVTLLLIGIPRIGRLLERWRGHRVGRQRLPRLRIWTSLASFAALCGLVAAGWYGSTDPVANPLPLTIWVFWWIGLVLAQALLGDLWRWFNPWVGPYRILRRYTGLAPVLKLPRQLGSAPAIVFFLMFFLFLIADLAPADPRRLSIVVTLYALFTLVGMLLFGSGCWLGRCEFVTIFMRKFAAMAPLACRGSGVHAGFPGWQIVADRRSGISLGLFVIAMLAAGSFESLYGTFWWLAQIGINPLDFPGRSAIFWPTLFGLLGAFALAATIFAAVVAGGLWLAGERKKLPEAFCRQAQCLLPIVAGYHLAHYLTLLLVDGQHLYAALSDPFDTGADLFGIGQFHVTVGFLNTRESVRLIWLAQAGAVVAGHILAILVSHAVALDMFRDDRRAAISQLPISLFMVVYTLFGLWLLASPRGM